MAEISSGNNSVIQRLFGWRHRWNTANCLLSLPTKNPIKILFLKECQPNANFIYKNAKQSEANIKQL